VGGGFVNSGHLVAVSNEEGEVTHETKLQADRRLTITISKQLILIEMFITVLWAFSCVAAFISFIAIVLSEASVKVVIPTACFILLLAVTGILILRIPLHLWSYSATFKQPIAPKADLVDALCHRKSKEQRHKVLGVQSILQKLARNKNFTSCARSFRRGDA
jgi:hypothetical protein